MCLLGYTIIFDIVFLVYWNNNEYEKRKFFKFSDEMEHSKLGKVVKYLLITQGLFKTINCAIFFGFYGENSWENPSYVYMLIIDLMIGWIAQWYVPSVSDKSF